MTSGRSLLDTWRGSVNPLLTMHHDKAVDGPQQKPEIVCNAPKSAVDNMDHLACIYSCKRKINRWLTVLFFNMLDMAAIASFVIWMCSNPDWNKLSKAIRRRQVIVSLGECLAEPLFEDVWTMQPRSEDQSRMQSNFYSWTLEKLKQELRD